MLNMLGLGVISWDLSSIICMCHTIPIYPPPLGPHGGDGSIFWEPTAKEYQPFSMMSGIACSIVPLRMGRHDIMLKEDDD